MANAKNHEKIMEIIDERMREVSEELRLVRFTHRKKIETVAYACTCKECGRIFSVSEGEVAFYIRKGLSQPKRCKYCRAINKRDRKRLEEATDESRIF